MDVCITREPYGGAQVRHVWSARRWPWALATVADTRRTWSDRRDVAIRFARSCPRCLDAGFGRKLQQRLGTAIEPLEASCCCKLVLASVFQSVFVLPVRFAQVDGVLAPMNIKNLEDWAMMFDCHTHDMEQRNAVHKRISEKSSDDYLRAKYVNGESKSLCNFAVRNSRECSVVSCLDVCTASERSGLRMRVRMHVYSMCIQVTNMNDCLQQTN